VKNCSTKIYYTLGLHKITNLHNLRLLKAFSFKNSRQISRSLIHNLSKYCTLTVAGSSTNTKRFSSCRQFLICFYRTFDWLELNSKLFPFRISKTIQGFFERKNSSPALNSRLAQQPSSKQNTRSQTVYKRRTGHNTTLATDILQRLWQLRVRVFDIRRFSRLLQLGLRSLLRSQSLCFGCI